LGQNVLLGGGHEGCTGRGAENLLENKVHRKVFELLG
jgi:hypothetical protein